MTAPTYTFSPNTKIKSSEVNQNFLDAFPTGQSYTPTWASSGTQPVIGNGSITGRYFQHGKLGWANINLSIGSTTTFGTGEWNFSIPFNGQGSSSVGFARALDSGTGYFNGVATMVSATTLSVYGNGASAGWSSATPMTWATNDTLIITITLEGA